LRLVVTVVRGLAVAVAARDRQASDQVLREQLEGGEVVLTGQAPLREVLVGAAVAVLNGMPPTAQVVVAVVVPATSRVVQGAVTAAAQEAASTRT